MDAKSRLKLEQLRNRSEACDRLIELQNSSVLPAQFASGYGPDGQVVVGLDGSVKPALYQSNSSIPVGRRIATRQAGNSLTIDQQPRRDSAPLDPPIIILLKGGLLALIVNYTADRYNRVGIGPYISLTAPESLGSTLQNSQDRTIIWADSDREWYGLHMVDIDSATQDLVWLNQRSTQYFASAEANILGEIISDYENLVINHFVQGLRGESASGALDLTHYFFNLRTGNLTTHQSTGTYTPITSSANGRIQNSSVTVSGTVKIFADLELPSALNITYTDEEIEEEIDGPWPRPGQIVEYHYFRNDQGNSGQTGLYDPGLGWTPAADRCGSDYFCIYRAAFNSSNAFRWLGNVPCPSGYAVQDPYLYTRGFGNHYTTVYSDSQASSPISGVELKIGGSVELRDGNLVNFTVVDTFDAIQELIITTTYPNPPVLPSSLYPFQFASDQGTNGFELVYSTIDPCLDPRPYTRTQTRRQYLMSGNRYQPLARNDVRVMYLEARGIDYQWTHTTAPAFENIADAVDEISTDWTAAYRCVIEDIRNSVGPPQTTEVTAYQPISLPFPDLDNPEIGVPYTFDYSAPVNGGWTYEKYCPAPNKGSRRSVASPEEDSSGVAPEWKAWFSAIAAKGDIPVFGKTYGGSAARPGSQSVKIFKGRITSIDYDDSITDVSDLNIRDSDSGNSWPVQFKSFTIVFDEFLVELADTRFVDGVYVPGYVDLIRVTSGSGFSPRFNSVAVIDSGSVLNAGSYGYSDTAYDLANALSINELPQALEGSRNFQGKWLYQSNSGALNFSFKKWEWRTRKNGAEEFYVHHRFYSEDASFYLMAYQLDNLIYPKPKNDKLHTLQAVFKLVTDQSSNTAGLFFERVELIANDIERSDVTDGNIYSFPDSTIIPS